MTQYLQDPVSLEWLILAPKRASRPDQRKSRKILCPFDSGSEAMTPPELMRIGGGEPNKTGWSIRVFPNLFPVTEIHEVLVHSPDHKKDLDELPTEQVEKIFSVYRDRYQIYRPKGWPLIFNNHGPEAGASLPHPHSQLTVIPSHIGTAAPVAGKPHNIAIKTKSLVVYCPDFSVWPYETWITPVQRGRNFGEIGDQELRELAGLTQRVLKSLLAAHPSLPYNFYIYPVEDWYLRIMGRSLVKAGFELGSGIQVNTVDPKDVVKILS